MMQSEILKIIEEAIDKCKYNSAQVCVTLDTEELHINLNEDVSVNAVITECRDYIKSKCFKIMHVDIKDTTVSFKFVPDSLSKDDIAVCRVSQFLSQFVTLLYAIFIYLTFKYATVMHSYAVINSKNNTMFPARVLLLAVGFIVAWLIIFEYNITRRANRIINSVWSEYSSTFTNIDSGN